MRGLAYRWLLPRVVPSFFLRESQLTLLGPSCKVHSIFIQLQHVASRELPAAAAVPRITVAPAGLEVKLLSLRSLPAHVVQRLGAVQAESKPLSRTSKGVLVPASGTAH